jgi:tetratricopeptide (TPR) repeat protein
MLPWTQLLFLMLGGVIGGFISGQRDGLEHKVRLPGTGRRVEMGIVGDVLIGAATSLAAYGVASTLVTIPPGNEPPLLLKLISFGTITGFTGIQLLSSISSRFVRDLQGIKKRVQSLERREESLWKSSRADSLREHGRYDEAEREFENALKLDPDNDLAVIGLAKVFRWTDKTDQAIETLTDFINRKPNARAIYNRACYKLLLDQRREAFSDLKWAIQIDPFYFQYAQKDEDFKSVRSDPEFPGFTSPPEALSRQSHKLREHQEETHESQ